MVSKLANIPKHQNSALQVLQTMDLTRITVDVVVVETDGHNKTKVQRPRQLPTGLSPKLCHYLQPTQFLDKDRFHYKTTFL